MGDLSAMLIPEGTRGLASFVARVPGVVAGTQCAEQACLQVDPEIDVTWLVRDGAGVAPGAVIGRVEGRLRSLLTAERTALNFLSHLSGVATAARSYVEAVREANPATRIWDTRKTTPGLRSLEKAAVRAGGAANHRGNLSDGVLIKDNHLGGLSITEAVHKALERWPGRMVEVECDRIEQMAEALEAGATLVMCDNMTPDEVRSCVQLVREHPPWGCSLRPCRGLRGRQPRQCRRVRQGRGGCDLGRGAHALRRRLGHRARPRGRDPGRLNTRMSLRSRPGAAAPFLPGSGAD